MKDPTRQIQGTLGPIVGLLTTLLGLALLGLIIGTVANQLGVWPRGWRALGPEPLAYICGAYWLWRKAG